MRNRTLPLLLLLPLLNGCPGQNVPASFVESEKRFYEAVEPEWRAYYTADPALTLEDKQRRDRTLELKRREIDEHEAALGASGGN